MIGPRSLRNYPLPMDIQIWNPDKKLLLTVEYADVTVNTPVSDEAFLLED